MAVRRAGEATGLVIATILFAILFVASTILAIVFYTQVTGANAAAEIAKEERSDLALDAELKNPIVVAMRQEDASGTVVGQLIKARNDLARIVTGSDQDSVSVIKQKLQDDNVGWSEGDTLTGIVSKLRAEKAAATSLVAQREAEKRQLQDQLGVATESNTKQKGEYTSAEQELAARVTSLQSALDAFKREAAAQQKSLEERLDQQQAQATERLAEMESQLRQKDLTLAEKDRRISDLLRQLPGEGLSVQAERVPDGRIISVSTEDSLAYINLGRNNRLPLGLTFEVYDKKTGVAQDRFGDWRGKATIEVVNLSDTTAACRIVRTTPGQAITPDDVIQNLVYDPDATFRFHVFGQFDLDGEGRPTDADRRRVEAMIQDWGGKLEDELSYSTDYLVLGISPDRPQPLDDLETNPEVIEEHARRLRMWEQYQSLQNRAVQLKVPVLNQNRFLALIGYYRR